MAQKKKLLIGATGWFSKDTGPGYETVAFCDIDRGKLEKTGAAHPDMRMYSDFKEMLKHPGLGAVIISTPNFVHAEQAIAALDAGKHVFLEKPMGINRGECDAIIAAQKRSSSAFDSLSVGSIIIASCTISGKYTVGG